MKNEHATNIDVEEKVYLITTEDILIDSNSGEVVKVTSDVETVYFRPYI